MKYILFLLIFFLTPNFSSAQVNNVDTNINVVTENMNSLPQMLKACGDGNCNIADVFNIISEVGKISIIFTTSVATIMFVYAGFLYITSQGDTNQVKRATGIFRNVTIGFVIILAAYMLVREFLLKIGLDFLARIIT